MADKAVKLSDEEQKALEAIVSPEHVLWPSSKAHSLVRHGQTRDGRVHFIAPTVLATGLFERGLINKDGEITPAGRALLSEEDRG